MTQPPATETTATAIRRLPPHSGEPAPKLAEVPAFVEMIGQGWARQPTPAAVAPGAAAAAERHRAALSQAIGQRDVVVFAGHAPIRNNDCYHEFRADSNFVWLTGCQLEFGAVVLRPNGAGHDATLFAPAPARPGQAGFFSSAAYGELWVGPSPGLSDWSDALDLPVKDAKELEPELSRLVHPLVSGTVAGDELTRRSLTASAELDAVLAHLRMFKDAWEVGQLREAVAASVAGFEAVAAAIPEAVNLPRGERWLQATFDRCARALGNGPGYASIVGSAAHAPILHWVRCDGAIDPEAPLLLDMGVEARSLYTADVTRTLPPSGVFSPAARQTHDLVE
ncbi:MAG: aminopeptidase P N-terminal domain-containing protein, partial [Bifidobacteriaceae bacterium]|nr:aminopeptidase P N-terminal domain-containing protein [Bifidobacteriaceae bacterium]